MTVTRSPLRCQHHLWPRLHWGLMGTGVQRGRQKWSISIYFLVWMLLLPLILRPTPSLQLLLQPVLYTNTTITNSSTCLSSQTICATTTAFYATTATLCTASLLQLLLLLLLLLVLLYCTSARIWGSEFKFLSAVLRRVYVCGEWQLSLWRLLCFPALTLFQTQSLDSHVLATTPWLLFARWQLVLFCGLVAVTMNEKKLVVVYQHPTLQNNATQDS